MPGRLGGGAGGAEQGVRDVEISARPLKIVIPGEMDTGDYAEYWGEGSIRVFDRNGVLLRTVPAKADQCFGRRKQVAVKAGGARNVKLTSITLGK